MMMLMMIMMMLYLRVPVMDCSRWKDLEGISPRFSPVNLSSSSVGSRTPADGRSVALQTATDSQHCITLS